MLGARHRLVNDVLQRFLRFQGRHLSFLIFARSRQEQEQVPPRWSKKRANNHVKYAISDNGSEGQQQLFGVTAGHRSVSPKIFLRTCTVGDSRASWTICNHFFPIHLRFEVNRG
ncbi:hypothetical protein Y032_0072g673 [Ancylostoma ceylanicum]|uniref:Uncharacterized protein n=1 Tax=Ancylostoma ceylanicum TaxID=53326 RepID=A0A016TWE0_9BILA|nr:hypothetical protein Y032_0072g673 [Ancylostoma ceylanicum]